MNSTALGATAEREGNIIFISDAQEKFCYEKLRKVRCQNVYHKALCLDTKNCRRVMDASLRKFVTTSG